MKTLFIGGTGIISSACSSLAIEKGMELYHLNRGKTKSIRHIEGVKQIEADIRNIELVEQALKDYNFDVVVDFLCFTPEQMLDSINLFKGRCKQFVFISSASAYEKPPQQLPIAEYTSLNNPYWQYSQDKKACEKLLKKSTENIDLSYTIVRPSHTYDKTLIPLIGGYTTLHRMIQGKPVVIHGDGSSVWTMTHHRDFAVGLIGLLGNSMAYNQTFHITSDEYLSWYNIYRLMAKNLGVELKAVYIPSIVMADYNKKIGETLLGDKMHSMIFDNSKIKSVVPNFNCSVSFEEGVKEIISFYKSHPEFQKVDKELDAIFDQMIADYV